MHPSDVPLVRVVVLTFDGGQMTIDCLDSLLATDWPADRLEIVLVDNGSLDDVADRVRAEYPTVKLLEPMRNLGFAGGCNLGIQLPGEHRFVALVNNDATVHPGWLKPLVEVADTNVGVGAVNAKLLFADTYLGVDFRVPDASRLSRRDPRELGVRVSAGRIDGVRDDSRFSFDESFYSPEQPDTAEGEEIARWSSATGALRISVDPARPLPQVLSLRLARPQPGEVTITTSAEQLTVSVGATHEWVDIRLGEQPFDVINNVGSCLFAGGLGGDRGFLERDLGQYDSPAEVFAWCGGAVLLRREYLEEVGMFDDRLFLYYEDTDLSWRGRLLGWRYLYEPRSVVRHRHAASSGVGSPVFTFYTERNRLLVLAKNAPARVALRAGLGELRRCARVQVSAFVKRPLRLQMPERVESAHRRKVLGSFLRLLPGVLRERRSLHPVVNRQEMMRWEVTK